MEEKVIIDSESYQNLWAMLNSKDKENTVVALAAIEQMDYKQSLPYILLLFKGLSEEDRKLWFKDDTDLGKRLKASGVAPDTKLPYQDIYDKVHKDCPKEAVQFVLDEFSKVLKKYIVEWGFEFVRNLDLNLKLKEDDNSSSNAGQ
jgi:hypothetical protein